MLNYIHGLSQSHNHWPCPSTGKPHVPKPTASRVTPRMAPYTPSPPLQGWLLLGNNPGFPSRDGSGLHPAGCCPLPSPPSPTVRLVCHSKVTWQEPPAGPGKGSLSLPHPPVPSPSLWPRAVRKSSGKRVKSQRFSSTAQRGSSGDRHCSSRPAKSCEL